MENPISNAIRKARQKAGLSQQELAARVGVSQKKISRIESGRDECVTTIIPLLSDIAASVGVSLYALLPKRQGGVPVNYGPGLRDLANDRAAREALRIRDDEIARLGEVRLQAPVDKDGYLMLLMVFRAIENGVYSGSITMR